VPPKNEVCTSSGVDRVEKVQGAPSAGAPEFQAKNMTYNVFGEMLNLAQSV